MADFDLIRDFRRHEDKIRDYILSRKNAYFKSDCFARLKRRFERLRDSYNLKIGSGNWKGKLVIPIVKEQQLLRRAVTMANFRADPLLSLEPIEDTPYENAASMQLVLNMNLKYSEYRRKVMRPMVNLASICGTGVIFSYYHHDTHYVRRTVPGLGGINEQVEIPKRVQQVRHKALHVLNYFQNQNAIEPDDSDYQGHIEAVSLSELQNCYENERDVYIQSNLAEVIAEMRDGCLNKDKDRYVENLTDADERKYETDRMVWFGEVHIRGNEDDNTIYYAEIIGDEIVRFQSHRYDMNLKPYSIFNYSKRFDYWWGNADGEDLLPHENYANLLLSISADKALQSKQSLKLFKKGSLDPAELANRAQNDGMVPMELGMGEDIRQLIYEFQPVDRSINAEDFMLREVKESMQRMSSKPDLSRPTNQGGLNNKTATAAQIMQGMQNNLDSDLLESFADGFVCQGRIDTILLQQFLGAQIAVKPGIKERAKILLKQQILGDFGYVVKSSLQKNDIIQATRVFNGLTQLINLAGTGRPEFQNMRLTKLGRDLYQTMELDRDVDEVLPEQPENEPGAVPSAMPQEARRATVQSMGIPGQGGAPAQQGAIANVA